LIHRYESLEGIYENLASIEPESLRRKLEAGKESAFLSKKLITLCMDVPTCPLNIESLRAFLDIEAAAPLFYKKRSRALYQKIFVSLQPREPPYMYKNRQRPSLNQAPLFPSRKIKNTRD